MKTKLIPLMLLAALAVSGCGLFGHKNDSAASGTGAENATPDSSGGTSQYPPPVEIGAGAGAGAGGSSVADNHMTPDIGVNTDNKVYFEFDSTAINDAGRTVVANFGRYLSTHPSMRLRLEGHADERGTREYNVGLGERRAKAVQEALAAAGASAAQLTVISFGEERPADPGHDEGAWAKNRRVEIVKQ